MSSLAMRYTIVPPSCSKGADSLAIDLGGKWSSIEIGGERSSVQIFFAIKENGRIEAQLTGDDVAGFNYLLVCTMPINSTSKKSESGHLGSKKRI